MQVLISVFLTVLEPVSAWSVTVWYRGIGVSCVGVYVPITVCKYK